MQYVPAVPSLGMMIAHAPCSSVPKRARAISPVLGVYAGDCKVASNCASEEFCSEEVVEGEGEDVGEEFCSKSEDEELSDVLA